MAGTTIYYTADIHGSERCWRKFLNAAAFYGADVLILGGDVTGKVLVPIVRRGSGWVGRILGEVRRAETEAELQRLEDVLRTNGMYPYVCDQDEYERLEQDHAYMRSVFSQQMRSHLARWIELADERLRGSGVEVYVMPGNDDEFGVEDVIEQSEVVVNPEGRVVEIARGQLEMVSLGWANPTPWHSPRECPDEELGEKIRAILPGLTGARPALFNLHVPPHGSGLDSATASRPTGASSSPAPRSSCSSGSCSGGERGCTSRSRTSRSRSRRSASCSRRPSSCSPVRTAW